MNFQNFLKVKNWILNKYIKFKRGRVMNKTDTTKDNINNVDELLAKYDKGSRFRVLSGFQGKVIWILLFCFIGFSI